MRTLAPQPEGFDFHAGTWHVLIMTGLVFVTYSELALLAEAWKMYDSYEMLQ